MDIRIRPITELAEAHGLASDLDRFAAESMAEYRDTPIPTGTSKRLLERHFEDSQCLLLVSEVDGSADQRVGVCFVVPSEDPLTGECTPMIVILSVDTEVRHNGLARALVQDALRILADRGHPGVAARAAHNDDARISMGERWGFLRQWEFMLYES